MDVHTVGVKRDVSHFDLAIVDRDEHQVDVGLCPDDIVREAAAEQGRYDRAVGPGLLDERVERRREALLKR